MNCIHEYIEKNFSEERKKHTYAVCEMAKKLAKQYGVDEQKAETAALFHDMYRDVPEKTINFYVRHLGMDDKYMNNVNLAHGKLAAFIMKRDYGIEDEDILNAVSYHTTGRTGMSSLEKVLYLADAVELNREYKGVEYIRDIAFLDMDAACLIALEKTIRYVESRGIYMDDDTILARDELKEYLRGKGFIVD